VALISATSIEQQISARRCLTCNKHLEIDDYICCKSINCFGELLHKKISDHTERIVASINEGLISDAKLVKNFSDSTKNTIKNFFSRIISLDVDLQESYIHYYLYLFWDELNLKFSETATSSIWFTSQSKKRPILGAGIEPSLVRQISSQIETDLIYINKKNETLYFVEVKKDSLCDRGVGQLYRYYEFISKQLPTTLFRQMNINYIKPVLILKDISSGYWKSFTSHFLENVLVYDIETNQKNDTVILNDRKSQVLSIFYR